MLQEWFQKVRIFKTAETDKTVSKEETKLTNRLGEPVGTDQVYKLTLLQFLEDKMDTFKQIRLFT